MQQITNPFIHIGGFTFNMMCLIAVDRIAFLTYPDIPDKSITLYLQDGIEHQFVAEDAIEFNSWFVQVFNPQGLATLQSQ